MKKLAIRVYGTVQGVFFRASAGEEARKLGVALLVARNEPDGSVYLEAEGEDAALKKFVGWCHKGPPLAKVERVGVIDF